jgi:hypothetical protein
MQISSSSSSLHLNENKFGNYKINLDIFLERGLDQQQDFYMHRTKLHNKTQT